MIQDFRFAFLFAGLSLFSASAMAQTAPPVFSIPVKDHPVIEASLKASLEQEVHFKAKSFVVDWSASSLKCMTVESSEMTPDVPLGVCSIELSAFQVSAKAAVLKTNHGYVVSILQADVD